MLTVFDPDLLTAPLVADKETRKLAQYIIEDCAALKTSKFECAYRVVRRHELTELLLAGGCSSAAWKMPDATDFYQPIVIVKKA